MILGRKAITNLDSILKYRDITLTTGVCVDKAMIFPVVTNGCESWTVKRAEHRIIYSFELWCWIRLLSIQEGNRSLIFIGRTDAEAEAPIIWLPDAKNRLTGKDPDARKD